MASGALESITLDGRRYSCANDDTVNIAVDGWTNETIQHSDGTFSVKKTRMPGHVTGVNVKCDNGKDDEEHLQGLAARLEPFPFSCTEVDGTVHTGQVIITDQAERDLSTNYVELSLEGHVEKMA